jgi:hypothetical protein
MILDELHFSPFGLVIKLDFLKKKKMSNSGWSI